MPPYILNMCMSQLPMKSSKPAPIPVSTSEKIPCDLSTGVPDPAPPVQLARALHENEPPPFSRRLQEAAVLQTPPGKTAKYFDIQAFSSCAESRWAAGTTPCQCAELSLMMMAPVSDAKLVPLTL